MPPVSALQISVLVLYSISFVASLVGNTLVLYIIYKKPYTRTTISYLFVNMAAADLIVTVVAMPESTAYYFRNKEWLGGTAGNILCRIIHFSFALAIAASLFTLAAMTLDRFIAVVYPLKASKRYSPKKSTIVIWLSSTILMFHRLLTFSTEKDGNCRDDWRLFGIGDKSGKIIQCIIYLFFLFILPLLLMAVLYTVMCTKLYHQERPGIADSSITRRRLERNRKVVKMLISVVVVFILCWVPVQTKHLLWALNKKTSHFVMFLCFWCGHSHSAINPWMYIYLNTQFRRAFSELIGKNTIKSGRNDNAKYSNISHRRSARRAIANETLL